MLSLYDVKEKNDLSYVAQKAFEKKIKANLNSGAFEKIKLEVKWMQSEYKCEMRREKIKLWNKLI
jgi:hypothetical protein